VDHLDGPRIEPRSRRATSLVVLLHGLGASGDDLIGLADVWKSHLPETAFVAPHAPQELDAAFGGYQWFPITFRDPAEFRRGVLSASPRLNAFLDSELRRYQVPPARLALVGFSQGTMMALHVGLRRSQAPAAIVGYSGMVAGPEHIEREAVVRPPVLLVHGEADDVIPVEAIHLTREALAGAGIAVEWHIAGTLGHGIDDDGLERGLRFLRQSLP